MIFKSIRLENFRQFKGRIDFSFSTDPNKPISLFIAENGVGKTTLVQAFRFCFYGNFRNNEYLNLPEPDKLITNTIVSEIDAGTVVPVMVEVSFEHNGIDYIMNRTYKYKKENNIMVNVGETSTLSFSAGSDGFKTFNENAESDLEMNKILPAGLSHVFMFDGERMEKDISSREFKIGLKESILGILNLKKYDSLINHLGDTSRKTSIIYNIYDRISHDQIQAKIEKRKYDKLIAERDNLNEKLENTDEKLNEINQKRTDLRKAQTLIEENKTKVANLEMLDYLIEDKEKERDDYASKMVGLGLTIYRYKLLLKHKNKYDDVVKEGLETESFYKFIHINTINEIIQRQVCICGHEVLPGSTEEQKLNHLKLVALPHSSATNLSFIENDIYSHVAEIKDLISEIEKLQIAFSEVSYELQKLSAERDKLSIEIADTERIHGKNEMSEITNLENLRDELSDEKNMINIRLEQLRKDINTQENKVKIIWAADEKNKKISDVVDNLREIKSDLLEEKERKEEYARIILSKHFNNEINAILSGNYETEIKKDYSIQVFNKDKNIDETRVLSTGQSVITSVSFIKSLIATAQELSEDYNTNDKYGVIMDAALSSLDEKHTAKVSENVLSQLDQLLFLSFKKQLRDEMYHGIKDKIGTAYALTLDNGGLVIDKLDSNSLESYVHSMEDNKDD